MKKYCLIIQVCIMMLTFTAVRGMNEEHNLLQVVQGGDPLAVRGALTYEISNDNLDEALLNAAIYGNAAIIRLLLGAGADINCVDADRNTPAHLAVLHENADALKALMSGEREAPRATGCWIAKICTSIKVACQHQQNINLCARNCKGETPSQIARNAIRSNSSIITTFPISYFYEIDKSGQTALHIAVESNNVTVIHNIISRAPDLLSKKDAQGLLAVELTHDDSVRKYLHHAMAIEIEQLQKYINSLESLLNRMHDTHTVTDWSD